jgi:PadR family transcriptional regulator, regulatory protein PadR
VAAFLLTCGIQSSTFIHKGTSDNHPVDPKLAPIRKGLLEFLVLKIVGARSVYVPDILRRLADTEFATQEGTLYPLLSKLRREDLVHYEWQESDAGPPRKYYRLTDAGRAQLAALDDYWTRINRTISAIGL